MQRATKVSAAFQIACIILLAVITYIPTLTQPLIEDDYPCIATARVYGPISAWPRMLADKVIRSRATTFVVTHWLEALFGLHAAVFYSFSILLHAANCILVYALGRWKTIGFRVSAWAAAFFAVYEGHQEAVMWYAAGNELLLFFFGLLCLLCWIVFIQNSHKWAAFVGSLVCFCLALLSKETAVIFIPLLTLPLVDIDRRRRVLLFLCPFVVLGLIYVFFIFQTRTYSFRFHDQSFQLSAPFWETWSTSFFALMLPWGWVAVIALFKWQRSARVMQLALLWTSIAFLPYMFVGYLHRAPSRYTYLASVGLALIVGLAIVALRERVRPTGAVMIAVLCVIFLMNVGYLWTRKHKQFLERAEPTEQLITFARSVDGPIYVRCFPRPQMIGDAAVEVMLGKPPGTLIWDEREAQRFEHVSTFCFEAKDR